ncbi:dTDP-4-dehydrorhamnose reductase [Chelativorans xinjiangense]|uniref:dTDP-4-dehydrorhamnose reductase n=1 Tax=Chelativorans xinjiangense TaxID=2681485 RepID=UPI00135CBC3E|nr:dTDP-4-dehydrorhamnose reductase [Chelativorans xinjiangense]
MRIVVTGSQGQVVQSLLERAQGRPDIDVATVGRPVLDLAHSETVAPALEAARPDLVVSAAAYTAVDQAEDEPERAFAINAKGAGAVAEAAAALGVPVIHLSTDYVFDGTKEGPYLEEDAPAPKSVYGASKLAGEEAVAAANPRHFILRTAWVYSPFGKNFVKTMLKLAETRDEVSVVADQAGNPTSALDIADGILAVVERQASHSGAFGCYHLAASGSASWYDVARRVFEVSRACGGPTAEVRAITTAEFPTKAKRPHNSQLDSSRFVSNFGYCAPEWHQSTKAVIHRLIGNMGPSE